MFNGTYHCSCFIKNVPAEHLILDYAGFRTIDSVIRANIVFDQNDITIVSQLFHNERALFLAQHYSISAIGFNAENVLLKVGIKTKIRGKLARLKVFIDLFIKNNHFLGKKIFIE